ncbi:MAG TPA: 2-methylisocitrate lyase [Gammaproteobacteria bacterium]|uniref:Isocitrate lyase/phosphoenolpyruvate mutase family protein n=1 Tax=OM182 bacterium TaxID=2510334 RepID=A0A520S1E9_9GAMM|nr:MAG: isocitrate lyase/phosphoenolpyruvate mutase family protein [OM182 bacterium]HAR91046.1 2-methylisocitrate lyase [Gammaproteobacteria bacterium]HAU23303.1 2-methylisocitrate lyase [Gammaproteobacteria bacterium]HCI87549.1 2-methylisocitrate lyase [Gammaproteobacteria bacterium]
MTAQLEKCSRFAELHQQHSAWLIPNPWDVGSARVLQGLGFGALATTSSGFAYTLGRADGAVTLEEKLAHCRELAAATDIPLNADFENGFSDENATLRDNVLRLIETGIAGLSIEDFSRDKLTIYSKDEAADRLAVVMEAIQQSGIPVLLTARAENLIRGVDDPDDTLERLQAYSATGAHVLYSPGLTTLEQIQRFIAATDKPMNVLAPFVVGASVPQLADLGVTRVSTGGALNWAAVNPLITAGKEMLEQGSFNWLTVMAKGTQVQALLKKKPDAP